MFVFVEEVPTIYPADCADRFVAGGTADLRCCWHRPCVHLPLVKGHGCSTGLRYWPFGVCLLKPFRCSRMPAN